MLGWALRLTAMLWVNHLAQLKQSRSTYTRVVDQRYADHADRWVNITCLLAE